MLTYGLENMHRKYHVVHRDIKPENILLTEKGKLSLSLPLHKKFHPIADSSDVSVACFELLFRYSYSQMLCWLTSQCLGYLRLIDLNIAEICEDSDCKLPNERKSTIGTLPYIGTALRSASCLEKLR